MKKILKILLIVGALLVMLIVVPIVYYLADIRYLWLHEYQKIDLNYGKTVQIYNNNLDDATSFYLTIEERQKFLIKEKFFWITFNPSSFSISSSASSSASLALTYWVALSIIFTAFSSPMPAT